MPLRFNVNDLAAKSVNAVRSGELKIVPEFHHETWHSEPPLALFSVVQITSRSSSNTYASQHASVKRGITLDNTVMSSPTQEL